MDLQSRAHPGAGLPAGSGRAGQRGLGVIGLIVVAGLLAGAAMIGMQLVPGVLEYRAARAALHRAVNETGGSVAQIQAAFDRFAAVDDITSVSGKDLDIARQPDGSFVGGFRYEKRVRLFGPASLVLDFQARSDERP